MQRIKLKLWRRSSRSIGDKPGDKPGGSSSSSSSHEEEAVSGGGGADEGGDKEPTANCRLCLCDVPQSEMYTMTVCACSYCTACCQQYLSVMILEGNVLLISCPDALCYKGGHFKPSEIEKHTDRKTYMRYRRLKFEREVALDPMRTFCPQVGCDTICHVRLNIAPTTDGAAVLEGKEGRTTKATRPVQCPTCTHVFCSVCKLKWHGLNQTCDEVMRKQKIEDQGIPFDTSEDAHIKRCPLCHVPIERNDGCAQMMCKRCKHLFCWYCQESLDDDFLLRHYDKGPCKNKLGHSRASVIWHRAQVVGIFAGVGVLMLIASPFLLLAAPCILFCKCKMSQQCAEDETSTSNHDDITRDWHS